MATKEIHYRLADLGDRIAFMLGIDGLVYVNPTYLNEFKAKFVELENAIFSRDVVFTEIV